MTGTSASLIGRSRCEVVLGSGATVRYDALVLATGAESRRPTEPGAELDGVMTLRGRADADALRAEFQDARSLVIVGGGFIGTEVAAIASGRIGVTLLERSPRILGRMLSAPVTEHVRRLHQEEGVEIWTVATVDRFICERGRVNAVRLDDGTTIDADMVLYAAGATPRTALAADAGLEVLNGVVVDESLRTSDHRISAMGDCANFPSPFTGGRVRLESVQNAVDQARHVAHRIATGLDAPYTSLPWFWAQQHATKIQIAGIALASDESIVVHDQGTGSFSVLRVRGGAVVAVESVNAPRDHMLARKRLVSGSVPVDAFAA